MKRYFPIVAVAAVVSLFTSGAVQTLFSALADQSERVPPTSGIYTGVQFSGLIGDAIRSISTGNKGATAPANVSGTSVDGLEWIDDSATPWIKKRYVNGGWAVEGALNPTDSTYAGVIGGGVASVASATTTDLNLVPQANVTITGTTTIAGFGSATPTGVVKIIRFSGILTLTHSSSLTIPGAANITTAANDRAIVTHLGSGNWEVTQYTKAAGSVLSIAGNTGAFTLGTGLSNSGNTINNTGVTSVSGAGLATGSVTTTGSVTVTAATQANQETGTSTSVAVTPGVQKYHPSSSKAWVSFSGTAANCPATVCAIQQSFNVSGVTRSSFGLYTVTFTTAFSAANYACTFGIDYGGASSAAVGLVAVGGRSAGSVNVATIDTTGAVSDSTSVFMDCKGDQ